MLKMLKLLRVMKMKKIISKFDASLTIDTSNLGHDIAVDSNGSIYVADAWANTLRKFELK